MRLWLTRDVSGAFDTWQGNIEPGKRAGYYHSRHTRNVDGSYNIVGLMAGFCTEDFVNNISCDFDLPKDQFCIELDHIEFVKKEKS